MFFSVFKTFDLAKLGVFVGAAFVCFGAASLSALGFAQEGESDWQGEASLRGNYYWERSTRVIAPEITGAVTTPKGTTVSGGYLLDAVTSASIAQGAGADVAFTEIRHQAGVNVAHAWDDSDTPFQGNVSTRFSIEPDYTSLSLGLGGTLELNQRATRLSLGLGYAHDEIRRNIRGGPRAGEDAAFEESLDAFTARAGFDQVITPTITAGVSYQFGALGGFLANAYRISSTGQNETHPRERFRHTFAGRISFYIEPTKSALRFTYRAYLDSWGIGALTPEVRLYQELGSLLQLRLRYRFYTQTRAYFYQPSLFYEPEATLVSLDPKMSSFQKHTVGIQLRLNLRFLRKSFLSFFKDGTVDVNFAHIWNNNRFGDGVIAQTGLRLPFE